MFTPPPAPFRPAETVLTVSALNRLAREALETRFPLTWVSGEVSNLTRAASGHVYFSLKDETAQARCVMFRNRAQLVPFALQNGQQVEARVLVSLYEPRGDFQLNVEALRRAGVGALYEAFTRLKDKLAAEGLFDAARKRPLPTTPQRIGVVTSLAAAALRDVLAALKRRARHVNVILYPAPVQGEGAGKELARRIEEAGERGECDVLILTRGGGSIEDLWAFNDETLAREIARCPIPVVCGVGHETDFTIADFAADVRAATPTAAAELVTAGIVAAAQSLTLQSRKLTLAMHRRLEKNMQALDLLASRLTHPRHRIALAGLRLESATARLRASGREMLARREKSLQSLRVRQKSGKPRTAALQYQLTQLQNRLPAAMHRHILTQQSRVDTLATHLTHLDPKAILQRGYSIVRDDAGRIIKSATTVKRDDALAVQFFDGVVVTRVVDRDQ
ncbi:MAG: hypothetical protein RIR70_545 [Pseudomonadota bacterium]|jgi:exodeoxyribonuclease VII large subunit